MYRTFFSLTDAPFSISPNPSCFYLGESHREAVDHLLYGVDKGGFVLLTGEVGTGKTTLSRYLLRNLPENVDAELLSAPLPDAPELFTNLLQAFLPDAQSENPHLSSTDRQLFEMFLRENHQRQRSTLVIIDEAQHLSMEVLEHLRLLTNIETDNKKLFQVMLVGQPELQDLLIKPECRQLAQRITARYHLRPLSRDEVDAYIRFRLQVVGCLQPIFTRQAVNVIARMGKGIPRIINLICERALLGAWASGTDKVKPALAAQAAFEVTGRRDSGGGIAVVSFCLLCAALYAGGWFSWQHWGWLPVAQINTIKVPVKLPPDASQMRYFQTAVAASRELPQAMHTLYAAWGYESDPDYSDCESASPANLRCYRFSGTLDELIALNYPAVIQIRDVKSGSWYAVLSHAEDGKATLLFGGKEWEVPYSWLQQVWQKSATLLWSLPDSGTLLISRRSGGEEVRWVDKALSEAMNVDILKNLQRFDRRLEGKIKAFQRLSGIPADGTAGEQTLMRLRNQTAAGIPRLNGVIPARSTVIAEKKGPEEQS